VPALLESVTNGRRFATTSGDQRRDYTYVDDVARAIALLALADVEGPVNVGSGMAMPVADLITAIAQEVGGLELVDFGALEQRHGDPEVVELSVQRLTQLGWHPVVPLAQGARMTASGFLAGKEPFHQ
jgi:nucleoside-diphosphate-sugar epimerase